MGLSCTQASPVSQGREARLEKDCKYVLKAFFCYTIGRWSSSTLPKFINTDCIRGRLKCFHNRQWWNKPNHSENDFINFLCTNNGLMSWIVKVFCLTTTCSKLICLFFPACKFLVNMMSNTKFRCVPCVIDSYPIHPKRWAGSASNPCSLCWKQHTKTWSWRRCGGAGWVCACLFQCFFPVGKWEPQLGPSAGGKGGHGSCSGGYQTSMGLVTSVEGEDPAIGMLL